MTPTSLSRPPDAWEEREFTLADLFEVLRRRRLALVTAIGLAWLAGAAAFLVSRPEYVADARLIIEEPSSSSGMLGQLANLPADLSALMGGGAPQTKTEMELLSSRPVAASVVGPRGTSAISPDTGLNLAVTVEDLDRLETWRALARRIENKPEPTGSLAVEVPSWELGSRFVGPLRLHFHGPNSVEVVRDRLFGSERQRLEFVAGEPVEYRPSADRAATFVFTPEGDLTGRTFELRREELGEAVEDFLDDLDVDESAKGSNVVRIAYTAPDAERAATVVNAVVQSYLDHNRYRFRSRAGRSITSLEQEIERVKEQLRLAEESLLAFGEQTGAVALPEAALVLLERLTEIDIERAKVELGRGTIEQLRGRIVSGELSLEDIAGLETRDLVASDLVEPLTVLLARRSAMQLMYTAEWPELRELDAQISDRARSIENILEGQAWRAEQQLGNLDTILRRYSEEMEKLPEAQVSLLRHTREVETFSGIFLFLTGQLEESKIARASAVPSVEVVEWAVVPHKPEGPALLAYVVLATLMGAGAGLGFVVSRELLARPVTPSTPLAAALACTAESLRRARFFRPLVVRDRPLSSHAEDFRMLRAALESSASGGGRRTLGVVSAARREGRTYVAANLALALARTGQRVLLIDSDLRGPSLHATFGLEIAPGLTDVLSGKVEPQDALRPSGETGLDLCTAGGTTESGVDGLAGAAAAESLAALADGFDWVIVDTPPALAASDATAMAKHVDALLLVARMGRVPEMRVREAIRRFEATGKPFAALVLNDVRRNRART